MFAVTVLITLMVNKTTLDEHTKNITLSITLIPTDPNKISQVDILKNVVISMQKKVTILTLKEIIDVISI